VESNHFIDFNRPALIGNELAYITEAIERLHISGDGYFTRRCHALLEQELGVAKVLLTTSCTHALEMTALLLDFKPGDEVILPSFTFVSSVNAFVLRGASPIFVDIRPDTLNLDENQLEAKISQRTRAVLAVHYAGVGCEMDSILDITRREGIPLVEDNAHGLFGKYKDKLLGTFGSLATLSFHETKNISCGEGGALLINDPALIDRAEIIREKGTNRSRFFRGQVDKYTWVDIGSSYLPSDILAAFLFAQLEVRYEIQARRKRIWERYDQALKSWAIQNGTHLPVVPPHCEQPYHMFYMILPTLEARQGLIKFLKSKDIQSVFHYLPLHLSDMGRRFGGQVGDCPVTEHVSDCLVRLPFHPHLNESDQARVIEAIQSYTV
jgi:dTDP-4-amino-4,6-dideoxygalactose transaminase